MLQLYVFAKTVVDPVVSTVMAWAVRAMAWGRRTEERGQTTAEYALVILAAAAVAVVLITWAKSSGKLPAFFDKIIDDITQ